MFKDYEMILYTILGVLFALSVLVELDLDYDEARPDGSFVRAAE